MTIIVRYHWIAILRYPYFSCIRCGISFANMHMDWLACLV